MKKLFSLFSVFCLLFTCLAPTGSAQSIRPGTEIQVRLDSPLDTGSTQTGEEFSATLSEPVSLEGGAVWPRGTQVNGRVVEAVSSGRLKRPASITLQLTQIGSSQIETETEQIEGNSHAGRNVALIGGGAVVGAILGSIAGGGKGAAIGTAVGAGTGTVTAAATGKQEIVLRAETQLSFVIAGKVAIQPEAIVQPVPVSYEVAPQPEPYQDSDGYAPYSPDQLDNLLAPVALYPDPLLAQVLVAATFPEDIRDAAWKVRGNRNPNRIDSEPWDVSVKAVAHYPTVLEMMNDRLDWTTALGQAYVYQSTDIMMSVQRLRNLAFSQGNLIATPQQQVILDRGVIHIVPAQARYIFVPVYDPSVIYVRRVYRPGVGFGGYYNFGNGFVIGAWLNYDLDWGSRRVVYNSWDGHHDGWRERSRPYVHVTNIYVDHRYENVSVNRRVVDRHVDYENVRRYNSVHRDVTFENRGRYESAHSRNVPARVNPQQRPEPRIDRVNDRVEDRRDDRREDRKDDRRFDRGNDRGNRNQPSFQERPARSSRSNDANFELTNQTQPAENHPQPESRAIQQSAPATRPPERPAENSQSRIQVQEKQQGNRGGERKKNDNGEDRK